MTEKLTIPNKIEKPELVLYEQINQESRDIMHLLRHGVSNFSDCQTKLEKINKILWEFWDSGQETNPEFFAHKLDSCNSLIQIKNDYDKMILSMRQTNDFGEYVYKKDESRLLDDLEDKAQRELMVMFFDMWEKKKINPSLFLEQAGPEGIKGLLTSCDLLFKKGAYRNGVTLAKDYLSAYKNEIVRQTRKPEFTQDKESLQRQLKSLLTYSDSREYKFILAKMKTGENRANAEFQRQRQRESLSKIFDPDYFQTATYEQIKSVSGSVIEQYAENLRKGKSFFSCLNGLNNFYSSFSKNKGKLLDYLMWDKSDEKLDQNYSPDTHGYSRCQDDLDNLKKLEKSFFNIFSKELLSISIDPDFDNELVVKNGPVIAKLISNFIKHARFNYYRKAEEGPENQKVLEVLSNLAESPKICRLLNKHLDAEAKTFIQTMVADMLNDQRPIRDNIIAFDTLNKSEGKLKIFGKWEKWAETKHDEFFLKIAKLLEFARGKNKIIDNESEHYERVNRVKVNALSQEEIIAEKLFCQALKKYGLDVKKTISAWETSTNQFIPYGSNLEAIIGLEKKQPGIVKYLQQNFNIAHFSRYPEELLITQYAEQKLQRKKNPYVVIINPYGDYNGAFAQHNDQWRKLYQQLQGKHLSLKVVEADDKKSVAEQLFFLYNSFGKAIGGFLGGHGEKDSIKFGSAEKYDEKHELRKNDLTIPVKGLVNNFFEDNSTLVLVSCSTGLPGGIAEELSKRGLKVIGPDRPANISKITPVYDQESGSLDFEIIYFQDKDNAGRVVSEQPAKVYRSGVPYKPPRPKARPHYSRQIQL